MNDSFSITLVREEKLFHLTNVIKDQDLLKRNWYNGIRIPNSSLKCERGEYQNFLHISADDKLKNAWSCRVPYPQFYIQVIRTCSDERRGDNG